MLPSLSSTTLHTPPHSRSLTAHSDPYDNTLQNVALVCILYLWGDGILKLVSKAPQLHQGTLLGALVTADAYPMDTGNAGHSFFCSWAGLRDSRPHCVFIILSRHYSHRNPEVSKSLRNTSKTNNNTSPRNACQWQHAANTAMVTSTQPKYYCLRMDTQPRRSAGIWASESKGWCRQLADAKGGCLRTRSDS